MNENKSLGICEHFLAEHTCGSPAVNKVFFWWEDISSHRTCTDIILLCEKHFREFVDRLEQR